MTPPLAVFTTPAGLTATTDPGAAPDATPLALFIRRGATAQDVASLRARTTVVVLPANAAARVEAAAALAATILSPVAAADADAAAGTDRAAAAAATADAAADVAAATAVAAAAARGRALLPLPPPAMIARAARCDIPAVRRLEDAVGEWSSTLRVARAAADGGPPRAPSRDALSAEAAHWRAAAASASSLADQLASPAMHAVASALAAAHSPAAGELGRLAAGARAAAADAADAAAFASALLPVATRVAGVTDIDDLTLAVTSLWRCIGAVWARSSHYGAPRRADALARAAAAVSLARVVDLVPGGGASLATMPPSEAAAAARTVLAGVAAIKAPLF